MSSIVPMSLRITATDGTSKTFMPAAMQHFHLAAPSGVVNPFKAPRITNVTYFEYVGGQGQGATLPTITAVAQYNGSNDLFEIGIFTDQGIFSPVLSNR